MTISEINQIDLSNPSLEDVARLMVQACCYVHLQDAVKKVNHHTLNKAAAKMEELRQNAEEVLISLIPKETPYWGA